VLVERDLLDALDDGHIAGAALDVFKDEPLPADSELWDRSDIVVTPHIATFPLAAAVAAQTVRNLQRYKNGEVLADLVDRMAGY
jgi:glyoxylate/hydroxypyruvate reductase A